MPKRHEIAQNFDGILPKKYEIARNFDAKLPKIYEIAQNFARNLDTLHQPGRQCPPPPPVPPPPTPMIWQVLWEFISTIKNLPTFIKDESNVSLNAAKKHIAEAFNEHFSNIGDNLLQKIQIKNPLKVF